VDLLFPCKHCHHNFEDHLLGLSCAVCWADAGLVRVNKYPGIDNSNICKKFEGDNLKYLEDKNAKS